MFCLLNKKLEKEEVSILTYQKSDIPIIDKHM